MTNYSYANINNANINNEEKIKRILKLAKIHGDVNVDVKKLREEDGEIVFMYFEKPCFLLIDTLKEGKYKAFLYSPFGRIEYISRIGFENWFERTPRKVFRQITGVKKIPNGKDAMEKIEALFIQASI